ncbi:MAG: cell division protein FtsQ/DivIB [Oligoflexus sp.]
MRKRKTLPQKKKLLDQQKPKRKLRIDRYLRFGIVLSLFAGVAITVYQYVLPIDLLRWTKSSNKETSKRPIELTIFPELEKSEEKTVRHIFQNIDQFDREELKQHLYEVQKMLSAKAISMIQIRPLHFSLFVEFHTPKFAIELGTTRFVNANGQVYGFFKEGLHSWLPIVKGLKLVEKPEFLEDQTMVLDEMNQTVVDEVLLLLELSLSYNITYRDIHFDPYRGFRGQLSNHRISVELGRKPFDTRLSRLRKILDDLAEKGVPSAHIELDFQDKAFVRELGT